MIPKKPPRTAAGSPPNSQRRSPTRTSRSEFVPFEEEEQIGLFSWAAMMAAGYPELELMYHIPNGGSRRALEGVYLKASGVKKGVPDVCLPVARGQYHALYIEMKRVNGGQMTKEQKQWRDRLNAAGNLSVVCRGADEAEKVILEYLSMGGRDD